MVSTSDLGMLIAYVRFLSPYQGRIYETEIYDEYKTPVPSPPETPRPLTPPWLPPSPTFFNIVFLCRSAFIYFAKKKNKNKTGGTEVKRADIAFAKIFTAKFMHFAEDETGVSQIAAALAFCKTDLSSIFSRSDEIWLPYSFDRIDSLGRRDLILPCAFIYTLCYCFISSSSSMRCLLLSSLSSRTWLVDQLASLASLASLC